MNRAMRVAGPLAGVWCACVAALVMLGTRPAQANIQSVSATACPGHLSVTIIFSDTRDQQPRVSYVVNNVGNEMTYLDRFDNGNNTFGWAYYVRSDLLKAGAKGEIVVNGGKAAGFEVSKQCPVLGRIAGSAYLDNNANGRRDRGEPSYASAWLKLTDGGSWFVCGWVGGDSTFGVTVAPGVYYLMPVAPLGYRTTTPRIKVLMRAYGDVLLGNDMGFVKDKDAKGESCDQYNPPRP